MTAPRKNSPPAGASQGEFLLVGGTPGRAVPDEDALVREIRAAWGLPIRERARVVLNGGDVEEIHGLLEVTEPYPDYPFDAANPLSLRIGDVRFSSRQIRSWSLA
ncbi:MAG: hypothetical protein LBC18_05490 [Opitutaceae bacterium]|jgi:hypothetical protein|nr:hypothetical protein [Opitutaceae bacterium]